MLGCNGTRTRDNNACMPPLSDEADWFLDQVRREQSRLRAFVRSIGVRSEMVDDLVQDALVLAFEKLGEFDRNEDFGAWVRGIARRLVANARRKEGRRQRILSEHLTDVLVEYEPAQPAIEDGDERLAALEGCYERIPNHSRELLQLRCFEELPRGTIATRLGRTANDVRQILFRLRRMLLSCVETRLGSAPANDGAQ